jgi:hypothetical protein
MKPIVITKHALKVIENRDLTEEMVFETILNPDYTEIDKRRP